MFLYIYVSDTKINKQVIINLSVNDQPSFNGLDAGSIIITRLPAHGVVVINGGGTVVYTPTNGYTGEDNFTYTIKDLKGKVSKAVVNIHIAAIDLFIPNTFTPNGDGKNDTFQIIGMEVIDNADLLVFNRWSNEVYKNKNYRNEWGWSRPE